MKTQGTCVLSTCSKVMIITSLTLVIVALVLQIAGYVTTGWYVVNIDKKYSFLFDEDDAVDMKFSYGLWHLQLCKGERDCKWYSIWDSEKVSSVMRNKLKPAQAQTKAALSLPLPAMVFIVLGQVIKTRTLSMSMKLIALLMILTSGILSLVAIGEMASEYEENVNKLKGTKDEGAFDFPYSLPIFGSGGALLCIVAFILLGDIIGNCKTAAAQESRHTTRGFQSPYVVGNRQIPVYVVNTPVPNIPNGYSRQPVVKTVYPQSTNYILQEPASPAHVKYVTAQDKTTFVGIKKPERNLKHTSNHFMPAL